MRFWSTYILIIAAIKNLVYYGIVVARCYCLCDFYFFRCTPLALPDFCIFVCHKPEVSLAKNRLLINEDVDGSIPINEDAPREVINLLGVFR